MVTPEQRQQLMDLIEATKGKVSELNTALFSSQNASEQARSEALREVFAILQQAGVDLQDPQSVADFLAKIREVNPEVAQMLEESLEALLTGEAPAPADNNMNLENEALPEDIRGPVPVQTPLSPPGFDGGPQGGPQGPVQ
jgi:hypothetical protein